MEQISNPAVTNTLLFIVPFLMLVGMLIAGGKAWGSLTRGLKTVNDIAENAVDKVEDLERTLHTQNGRTTYMTRIECNDYHKVRDSGLLIRIDTLSKKIDDLSRSVDDQNKVRNDQWTQIAIHMGQVHEFMEAEKSR